MYSYPCTLSVYLGILFNEILFKKKKKKKIVREVFSIILFTSLVFL